MINMDQKLIKREQSGEIIMAGIVGAGQMGRGLVAQMVMMKGIKPAVMADHKEVAAVDAFKNAGIADEDIAVVETIEQANVALEAGKYVATTNTAIATSANAVQVLVDVTGRPDAGAKFSIEAMDNGKHVVMMNVETDVVIGPYLKRYAESKGVLYTGSAGDEPGAVMELYSLKLWVRVRIIRLTMIRIRTVFWKKRREERWLHVCSVLLRMAQRQWLR
jgi:predicted homoserine dehydrogenase-like protein